jgi:hypothetical protein
MDWTQAGKLSDGKCISPPLPPRCVAQLAGYSNILLFWLSRSQSKLAIKSRVGSRLTNPLV